METVNICNTFLSLTETDLVKMPQQDEDAVEEKEEDASEAEERLLSCRRIAAFAFLSCLCQWRQQIRQTCSVEG